ncbi:hypothetical protein BH09BAC1_BH09BAC1_13350 [soil metagenome]
MRYTMLLLSVLVLAATSCKKDDNDATCKVNRQVDNNTGVVTTVSYQNDRVYRLEQSNGTTGQLSYNAAGRVSLYEIFVNNNKVGYAEFEYTSAGQFLERRTFQANLIGGFDLRTRDVYEYTGDHVTKITNYDLSYSSTSINSYTTYSYNTAGNVESESMYGRDGSSTIILKQTITYQYDDKINVAGDLGPFLSIFSKNNPTNRNTTVYHPSASNTVETIAYEYNEFGYPTRATTTNGSNVTSYTVEYACD